MVGNHSNSTITADPVHSYEYGYSGLMVGNHSNSTIMSHPVHSYEYGYNGLMVGNHSNSTITSDPVHSYKYGYSGLTVGNHSNSTIMSDPVHSYEYVFLFHDYNLCFNGSPCYSVIYYNYNSVWPYSIDIQVIVKCDEIGATILSFYLFIY